MQPLYGPLSLVCLRWPLAQRCQNPSLCLDRQFQVKLEGDTLLGITFEKEPSPQPTLGAFS
jgi:hypothetical protein